MIREHIQGVVDLDNIITELKNDPEYYHIEYIKLVRGHDVIGRLKDVSRKTYNHVYTYKEQDTLGYKFRGFLFIPIDYDYYIKLRYIV